jgi:polar amino acid transport system permease protein
MTHLLGAFDSDLFWSRIFEPDDAFWRALWATIYISVVAQLGGVTLGLVSALAGRSRLLPPRLLNLIYVTVFRGTPVICCWASRCSPKKSTSASG